MKPPPTPKESTVSTMTCAARSPAAARSYEATIELAPIARDTDGVAQRLRIAASSDAQKVWLDMSIDEATDLGIAILAAVGR